MKEPKPKRSKSHQRILMERLQRANLKPRAWMVALVLEGFARLERDTGRRIASLYHAKIGGITRMSVGTVRRALAELIRGPHPLYRKRNATGQQHTIFGNNGWELTTTSPIYEWIDTDMPPDTPSVSLGATPAEQERKRGRKPDVRCLTASQVEQFAADLGFDPGYGDIVGDGQQRVAEHHALRRHVIEAGCARCQIEVARAMTKQFPEMFQGVTVNRPCHCGAPVARCADAIFNLGAFIDGKNGGEHQCVAQ